MKTCNQRNVFVLFRWLYYTAYYLIAYEKDVNNFRFLMNVLLIKSRNFYFLRYLLLKLCFKSIEVSW